MRLHDYVPPVRAAALYAIGTPDELAAASALATERLQEDEYVDPLAAAYQAVIEAAGRRMARSFRAQAVSLSAAAFVPPDEDEVIGSERLAREMSDGLSDAIRDGSRVVVAALDDEGITFDVDTVFTDELLSRIGERATTLTEQALRDQYRFTLEVAADQGWSVRDTAEALTNKISELAPAQARALARTDLNALANGGSVHVAQVALSKQPEPVYKTWLATDDERTREAHVDADGQTVPINDNFIVDGFPMPYPGYPFAPPELVINCRCTVTYSSDPEGGEAVVRDPRQPGVEERLADDPLDFIRPSDVMLEEVKDDLDRHAELEASRGAARSAQQWVADWEAKLTRELSEEAGVDIRIRTPDSVALEVIEDGRFKSQFEARGSGGMYSPDGRRHVEGHLFSYPDDLPDRERPIYGYVGGITHEAGQVSQYGDVTWVLKNSVRLRTTWTADDSLSQFHVPSPIDRPSALSANPMQFPERAAQLPQTPLRDLGTLYHEAQIHGGVTLDDVARVEVRYWSSGEFVPDPEARDYALARAAEIRTALGGRNIDVSVVPYEVNQMDMMSGSAGSDEPEHALGLGDDGLEVGVVGDLDPVPASDEAEGGHLGPEQLGAHVEDAPTSGAETVTPPLGEEQVVVVAALRDDPHTSEDTSPLGGSQPSDPLALTPMPYHVEERDDEFCVIKDSDGEVMGCHDTREEAVDQIAAIEANEEASVSTTTTTAAAGDGEVAMLTPIAWDAVLAVEGEVTEDGRLLERGSIAWRDLPLTLMAMLETSAWGHEGARAAGRIDTITRVINDLASTGELTSEWGINEVAPLIADRTVRGVSVDLAVLDYEYRSRDGQVLSEEDLMDYWLEGRESEIVFTVLDGTIVGATVCPMPAIANAEIALAASAGLAAEGRAILAAALGGREQLLGDVPIIKVFTAFDRPASPPLIADAALFDTSAPPRAHFELTEFPGKTPLTVTDDGRVFGHIATWDTCHVGIPGVCTTAPRSSTDPTYALFHTGQYPTAEGELVDVGKLMLGTGHASLGASRMEATQHYDKPDMVGAYVRAVDGEHGIWVSGVVRPELTNAGLRELRANPPSGDWRSYNGRLELIAVCAVAVPGFPVVASAEANLVASGGEVSLSSLIASAGQITPSETVKAAMVAAGCACDELATEDETVDDLAELALQ